jgi:hypothetical protein
VGLAEGELRGGISGSRLGKQIISLRGCQRKGGEKQDRQQCFHAVHSTTRRAIRQGDFRGSPWNADRERDSFRQK